MQCLVHNLPQAEKDNHWENLTPLEQENYLGSAVKEGTRG
jgi:hypothetical protein